MSRAYDTNLSTCTFIIDQNISLPHEKVMKVIDDKPEVNK